MPDTSRDLEFARWLSAELNRGTVGAPGGVVYINLISEEEEELFVHSDGRTGENAGSDGEEEKRQIDGTPVEHAASPSPPRSA